MRTRPYHLAVLAFAEMDLLDIAGPLEVFSSAGRKWNWRAVKASLVASTKGTFATRAQLTIGPAAPLESCPEPELILIPGGYGARLALEDTSLVEYLSAQRERVPLTLAIGLGCLLAARAGLLHDSEVACPAELASELTELDASIRPLSNSRTATAPRAITAARSGAAVELGLETVARLLGKKQASATAQELAYPWGTETFALEIKP